MKKTILSIISIVAMMAWGSNADAQVREKVQNTVSNVSSSVTNTVNKVGNSVSNTVSNIEESMMQNLPPYKLGVTVGFNSSRFSNEKFNPKAGFNLGLDLMLDASDIINNTYTRIELLAQRKGARLDWLKNRDIVPKVPVETKIRTLYIEIPIHYGYAYRLNRDWSVMGETGPYLAFGLGGHYHTPEADAFQESHPQLYKVFNSYPKFFSNTYDGQKPKRLDLGWGFAAGAMLWNQHQFMLKYDFGAINMNDAFQQNRNFQITYTYFFE